MRERRALIAAGLFGALLAIVPATAAAQQPQCGDEITEDTTLQADIRCDLIPPEQRPDVGLTIGADDVTLDLGGYRVVGNSADTGMTACSSPRRPQIRG